METPRESLPYQLFMLSLCAYTLLALAAEVVLRPEGQIRLVLNYADTAICAAFLLDFVLCLYRAPNRLRYLYTCCEHGRLDARSRWTCICPIR